MAFRMSLGDTSWSRGRSGVDKRVVGRRKLQNSGDISAGAASKRGEPLLTEGGVSITQLNTNETSLISLYGEHDIATIPLLDRQMSGILSTCQILIVDLSDATFIDCSVVGWIVRAHGAVNATTGHELCVVAGPPTGHVQRILDIDVLPREIRCYSTLEWALAETADVSTPTTAPPMHIARGGQDAAHHPRRWAFIDLIELWEGDRWSGD